MDMDAKHSSTFNFTWSIEKFSHYFDKKDSILSSPYFHVEFLGCSKFYLELHPQIHSFGRKIYLRKLQGSQEFFYNMMVRNSEGIFVNIEEDRDMQLYSTMDFVLFKELDSYLLGDKLTVRCCILKHHTGLPMTVWCHAHSEIKVTDLIHTWRLEDFVTPTNLFQSKVTGIPNPYSQMGIICKQDLIRILKIFDFYSMVSDSDDVIYFAIGGLLRGLLQGEKPDKTFSLAYNVALLDSNGSVSHSVKGKSLFIKHETIPLLHFPFLSKRKLLLNKELYLPNGSLTVQCNFSVSANDVKSCIKSVEFGISEDLHFKPFESRKRKCSTSCEMDLWEQNKEKLCTDGKFSDFIIRSASRDFPVHKAILGSQSEVFSAMFEHDMKEKNAGVVEIDDLEDDTISKLLSYVYTKRMSELDFSSAQKLYFAADRYRIAGLKVLCSEFMKKGVDASNVCDIAVLADTHQDQELKSHVLDYISAHASEIIDTEAWKSVMETHPHVTSEIMQKMLCKQLLKDVTP